MASPDAKTIGKYEIQAELGRGGFGIVYRAFDPTVGRPVAIKILTVEANKDVLTRFRNEATSAGNLRHRNIVTVHDYGEFNDRPYLVMELLEGQNLADLIASGKKLSLLEKMNIMDQVADGLECAHRSGVVHRDVKPANIQLLPDGTVKIMDFGIARVNHDRETTRLTQQGDLIGTILYMSPEQFGGSDADALCDIFAYGVTYFEFLTGKHPFLSSDPRTVMFKITVEETPSLLNFDPKLPPDLDQVLNRALQKDRELRYQTLRDLRLDTEPLILELKREKARTLVAEAQQLSDAQEPQKALVSINAALDLDVANRDARQLRELIQRQLQKDTLQPRINTLLETAQDQVASRSFALAVQTLEGALRLDQTDTRIREALEQARGQLQSFKEAARAGVAAVSHMKRGDWAAAAVKAAEAKGLDPANTDAIRVLDAVGKQRLQAILDNARRLTNESRFEDALQALLDPALPDDPDVRQLRKQAEDGIVARRRAEREKVQRAEAVRNAADAAQQLLAQDKQDEALESLQKAAAQYPGEEQFGVLLDQVMALKQSRDRQAAIQGIVQQAEQLTSQGRFAEALAAIDAGLQRYDNAPVLANLLRRVVESERQERKRRAEERQQQEEQGRGALLEIQRLEEHADVLLGQNRPEVAIALIADRAADSPKLGELLARAKKLEETKNRERMLQRAREFESQGHFEEGLTLLAEAIEHFGTSGEIFKLQSRMRGQLQDRQRRHARREQLDKLNAIEKQVVAGVAKEKLEELGEQARQIAATHAADNDFVSAAARIQAQIEAALATQPTKRIPWVWIAAGLCAVALVAAIMLVLQRR